MTKATKQQQNSLHLWARQLASALNDGGFSINDHIVFKTDIGFTEQNIKENMIKPLMRALYPDLTSTTKLDTKQISELYLHIDKVVSERTGVSIPFPSEQEND